MLNNDEKIYKYDGVNPQDGGPHAVQEIQNASGDTLKTYEYDDNGNITKITGQSTVLIRAKGDGVEENPPRMELWVNGQGPQTIWHATSTDYQTYSWHGYIPAGSTVSVLFGNDNSDGGVNTNLYVDYISVNGVTVQSESSGVTYDQGGYSSGCFDGTDTLAGQEQMNLTGALHYLVPSGADAITRVLDYDSENRLTSIQDNGSIKALYRYDDMGQRILKIENGVKTYYFFANYEEEYEQSTGDFIQATTYYFANGQRVAQRKNGEVSYYHTDHLGSAVRMTDEDGNITQSVAYTPFGKVAWFSGKDVTHYTFTGQEADSSGFMYYNARYYDPDLGRFLQPDTALDGMNRYTYCGNNPEIYTDPTGQSILAVAIATVIVVSAAYISGHESSGSWNPADWNKEDWINAASLGTGSITIGYSTKTGPYYDNDVVTATDNDQDEIQDNINNTINNLDNQIVNFYNDYYSNNITGLYLGYPFNTTFPESDPLNISFPFPIRLIKESENGFYWPTDSRRITNLFDEKTHKYSGIDIGAIEQGVPGDNIYAAENGYVDKIYNSLSGASYIRINGDSGIQHVYVHTSNINVAAGDRVYGGQIIAKMSDIGAPGQVHLHYEQRFNGIRTNPFSLRYKPIPQYFKNVNF